MWAEGYIVGAVGELGYFEQQNDALIAQYRIADIYHNGYGVKKDQTKAYLIIKNVIKNSKGEAVFFCCEWSSPGLWFTEKMFEDLSTSITNAMTKDQITEANTKLEGWTIKNGL